MASSEHVKIIKEGVPTWNKWRKEHPDIIPNLDRANLRGADLRGANLSRANLRGANLRGADLSRAGLCGADLRGANLSRAGLCGADLKDTGIKEVISLLPFPIVVLEDNKVQIGCGEPRTIKGCLSFTENKAFENGLPRDRYKLYQAILRALKIDGEGMDQAELFLKDMKPTQLHHIGRKNEKVQNRINDGKPQTR